MTIQNEQRVKQAELGKLIELAENYLAAAVAMREQGKYPRQVIDLGYNAAELCAKALILAKQDVLRSSPAYVKNQGKQKSYV